jgi:hypothetical protein
VFLPASIHRFQVDSDRIAASHDRNPVKGYQNEAKSRHVQA